MRSRRPSAGLFVVAGAVALLVIAAALARFYTDVLWFGEVGLTSVLVESISTQAVLGVIVGAAAAAIVWANLVIAGRLRRAYRPPRSTVARRPDPLAQYRDAVAPYLGWIRVGAGVFVGLSAGIGAAASWRTFLLWANRVPFGVSDPQFGRDVGFYVFELPFYEQVLSWLWFAVLAALVLSLGAHYLQGSIRPEAGTDGVAPGALAHLSVLLGLLALVKALQYWLGQFQLNFSPRGVVHGASYTDVHAQLPALKLLAVISVISAGLFLVNIAVRRFSLPAAAVGIWILTAFLAGGVWPWWVQRFSVEPQELQREQPFIARNLEATRAAYGLDDVDTGSFPANTALSAEAVEEQADVLQNVRLLDPDVLELAYQQLQSIRLYYSFQDVDIDRYAIDGRLRQVLLSARELSLDNLPTGSKNWPNLHLRYTHGYGIVASLANDTTAAGQPEFIVKDVPGSVVAGADALEAFQARLYYGEGFEPDEYSIVDSKQDELDFPTQQGVESTNYAGRGGVSIGSFLSRLAFAIREGDYNLMLSSLITDDSDILIYKNVRDRVLRAAPFLALDHDPYVAVVDGRLVWILDAYTTTRYYPYSQRFEMDDILGAFEEGGLSGTVNYLRNSVKVVVDAYDGTMDFYVVEESDPLVRAWRSAFPALFAEDDPSPELAAHFRYPEDLFNVQSEVYLTYHMTDPADFFAKEDAWEVPDQPVNSGSSPSIDLPDVVPPTYLLVTLPGETDAEFVLTRPFTPRGKNNMIALMVARSDPENYGELSTFQFPRQRVILGPGQVNNLINQDVDISQLLSLLRQRGSSVDFGSLVILPISDALMYVQPLFVTAETDGIPELKRVVIVLGEQIVIEETFDEALATLFGLPTEAPPDDLPPDGEEPPDATPGRLGELVERAAALFDRAQDALSRGDFAAYGRLVERVGRILEEAQALSDAGPGPR